MTHGRDDIRKALISRRGALLLPMILGAAGCTQWAETSDPYIGEMKKDPMYSWNPSLNVKRHIGILPRDATLERVPLSVIDIWLTPDDPELVSTLFDAATQAREDAGYSERHRRPVGKIGNDECWINCSISKSTYSPGVVQPSGNSKQVSIHIALTAPYLEP